MGYTIRKMDAERNLCQEPTIEVLHRVVPPEAIAAVLTTTEAHTPHMRKLTAELTIWVLIAVNLHTHLARGQVLRSSRLALHLAGPVQPCAGDGAQPG
jgi:hypothetical protein